MLSADPSGPSRVDGVLQLSVQHLAEQVAESTLGVGKDFSGQGLRSAEEPVSSVRLAVIHVCMAARMRSAFLGPP